MNVFDLRNKLITDYKDYVQSFIQIRDDHIRNYVENCLSRGELWPEPLIQLNPSFEPGEWIDELVDAQILHSECRKIFRIKEKSDDAGKPLRLHKHQSGAIRLAQTGKNYVLTTGTGSGKSLAYVIPIVNYILRHGSGKGIQAIIVYPMNALANSQMGELEKFLHHGYPEGKRRATFARYTGQEDSAERERTLSNPPDILLTNYVMLELILTRPDEKRLIQKAQGLKFLVLDELHTYRGRQGADVGFLNRRVQQTLNAPELQFIGTSATLAGSGSFYEQRKEVAEVAKKIFGSTVEPECVIGETLRRSTSHTDLSSTVFIKQLTGRINNTAYKIPKAFEEFVNDPLSIWIESTFGLIQKEGHLVRAEPRSIYGQGGAAIELSQLTGLSPDKCAQAIEEHLLAGYQAEPNPDTGFRPFAFRLHQFISKGDTVYVSLENENERHITVNKQQFVPGTREKILLPLVFCRECGQEYYVVRKNQDEESGEIIYSTRELDDQQHDDFNSAGFLYFGSEDPWPDEESEQQKRLPDDWLEEHRGELRVRPNRRQYLPEKVFVNSVGIQTEMGLEGHYFNAPFRFCLKCGVSYGIRQIGDFAKLASLSSEGRSTATTILSLSAVRFLKNEESLKPVARKLLSFTDNRQDASLQSGHFNDFIEIGLIRSALFRAAESAGTGGLEHDSITQKVYDALDLPLLSYAANPEVRFQELANTKKAMRNVLGYRLYCDLKRGWRITSPNLEQCGLLEIQYTSLDELCAEVDIWESCHPVLAEASQETRSKVLKVLLDFMRRELAIKVDYLDQDFQERLRQQSSQYLISPWAIDEDEANIHAAVLYPRPAQRDSDYMGNVFLSPRGGFGQYLKRSTTFGDYGIRLKTDDIQKIILDLLENLRIAGIVEVVEEPQTSEDVAGFQLKASALKWMAGDGTKPFHDPIRVPQMSELGGRTNPFFVEYYRTIAAETENFESREHTAQVPYEDRIIRESRFREANLPILYCSPTMELGVDIAQLNVVNMRNVPPTPANYAQRSGRAGRSGQPALVFTYCSTGSSHDQYFFKRPRRMVSGAVSPPRLDLANQNLVMAHVHAIWLTETGFGLGKSLKEILDLSGDDPTLEFIDSVKIDIENLDAKVRALAKAEQVLHRVRDDLKQSDWYYDGWLKDVIDRAAFTFDRACDRWRTLYRSAMSQARAQDKIIRDATRPAEDKRRAERLRREAESQLKLLTEVENVVQSDFYSYRYFASEGFLPGYNFPRLPLSAYIPGRRTKQRDEFLSRPRFLAISEFGPRSIIYHEGSKYVINKVIMPMENESLETQGAKICHHCGYLHPITGTAGADVCDRCKEPLNAPLDRLFRLQNVSTKRRERINSDEEERMRLGFELLTGIRFVEQNGRASYRIATIHYEGKAIGRLMYGDTATIWRINLGWRRRKEKNQFGFALDVERGFWERNALLQKENEDEAFSNRVERVIPFVEDHRNCLVFEPMQELSQETMASLQAALKIAIQVTFQLEDNELASEPLPDEDTRNSILFYESAEGGAGVLRRLVYVATAFPEVAREALDICHFDPSSGKDLKRAPGDTEDCEAACYSCLMNYGNQRDHELLDRQEIRNLLIHFSRSKVDVSPVEITREAHLKYLLEQCASELEKEWLLLLEKHKCRLPSQAQYLIEACGTRPDFYYQDTKVAVYIDGPHHDFPERQERDGTQTDCLEDHGYIVIRFGAKEDWEKKLHQFPNIFGLKH
ncbi:MAG: hypothetical protein CV087_06840 [Candidatus Brocadia sp. WS118]|nr:MAG: hypothetical protein CV087_06840 [Candidatus Brocadia sp. WS118]